MTNLLGEKLLLGRYVWLVSAYEATDRNPMRHREYRIEFQRLPDGQSPPPIVFDTFEEAQQFFDEMK